MLPRGRSKRLTLVVITIFAVALSLTGVAGAAVRSCSPHVGLFNFRGGHQEYIADLSVRNMTCRQALHALHHAYLIGWPPNLSTAGFQCHIIQGGGGGATDRCRQDRPYKAFRVSIAT